MPLFPQYYLPSLSELWGDFILTLHTLFCAPKFHCHAVLFSIVTIIFPRLKHHKTSLEMLISSCELLKTQ